MNPMLCHGRMDYIIMCDKNIYAMPAQAAVGASRIGYENYHEALLLMTLCWSMMIMSAVFILYVCTLFQKKKLHAEQKNCWAI